MKKPDAFRKMIIPMLGTSDLLGKNGKYLSVEVAKLLRAHHRRIVRMVERTHNITVGGFRKSVLAKLKAMEGK